jgi:phage terminase large subunit
VKCDNARPDLISHQRQNGYSNAEACSKWPGSVEAGIDHLRSYDAIVIHTRCTHAAEEAKLWSFKVDRLTGKVLPEQVDAHNHIMDAARYALEDHVRSRSTGGIVIDPQVGSQENPYRI